MDWLEIHRGEAPLVVAFPHTGTEIPTEIEREFVSPRLARKDTDWWIDQLYGFARGLGATTVRTRISRSVIDVNRDPSGLSLYPGQATTELCPTTTFDGEGLYAGPRPEAAEIENRRTTYFAPYHEALVRELDRLRETHGRIVLYDAHSIRSRIPRLFEGELPHFNLGTNSGASCSPELASAIEAICDASTFSRVTNGRFKGGWTTRRYGAPDLGVHAVQMELACRSYMDEPSVPAPGNWPTPYSDARAAGVRAVLTNVLEACLAFAKS